MSSQPDEGLLRKQISRTKITQASNFESQVKAQMDQLREQQKEAEEMRQADKMKQQQSLKEKLKMRSGLKKLKKTPKKDSKTALNPRPTEETMPATKKEVLYSKENTELFRDLEKYAIGMETNVTSDLSFNILMDKLYIGQLSDLEKVRILFHWITAQDLNSLNALVKVDSDSPMEYFLAIKEDKTTYAALFVRLCEAAGIHAKMITGYLKGAGYLPDYHFGDKKDPFRGTWNAVLIEGQWRLLDTNWGSRHVTEEAETSSTRRSTGQPEYKYEEHYFLTDPDLMIDTHFPDEDEWQLLKKPISLKRFEKMPKLWPLFYKLKLQTHSHKEGLIHANDTGYVKIQLRISAFARSDAKLKAELRSKPKEQSSSENTELQHYVFHHNDTELETFEIYLPSPGEFILKIFGLSKQYSEKNIYVNICMYQITCSQINNSPVTVVSPPIPIVSLFYGPNVANFQVLARPVSHIGPVVGCNEKGEAIVTMLITASDSKIAFANDLFDAAGASLSHQVLQSYENTTHGVEITFVIRVPQNGNYALAIYSNIENTSSNSFIPFCYYLVNSKVQTEDLGKYPAVPNDVVGIILPKFYELSLSFKFTHPTKDCDWKRGFLKTDENGEVIVIFGHDRPMTILTDFHCTTQDASFNKYTTVKTIGLSTSIILRTPSKECGNDKPFILKVYAADVSHSQQIPSVYVALVQPYSANIEVQPFPQSPTRFWGPGGLSYYKSGIISFFFKNSSSHMDKKCSLRDFTEKDPYRIYKANEDFELILNYTDPLQMKTKLQDLNDTAGAAGQQLDNMMLLSKADINSAFVTVRFPHPGQFMLVIYGCELMNKSGQLSPLLYILIEAINPSSSILPFPNSFGLWASSARTLYSPLEQKLERNKEATIKAYLARYQKDGPKQWKVVPYPDVVFVVDGSHQIKPKSASNGLYEWKYAPGPGEKLAGILVKAEASSHSMAYALQYQIE